MADVIRIFQCIFPRLSHILSHSLPEVHKAKEEFLEGKISEDKYEHKASIACSKTMSISYVWKNIGLTVCGTRSLATLAGIGANDSTSENIWGYSVAVGICTGFWIIFAIPWFFWGEETTWTEAAEGDLTFGFKQTYFTAKQAWRLKQTLLLPCGILLADGIGTTTSLSSK